MPKKQHQAPWNGGDQQARVLLSLGGSMAELSLCELVLRSHVSPTTVMASSCIYFVWKRSLAC